MANCRCGNRLDSKGYCHECKQYDTTRENKDFFEKKCSVCKKIFTDLVRYMDHLEDHPQCICCHERFVSEKSLMTHYKSHHKCSLCNEYYESLSEHVAWSHPFCDICQKRFLNTDAYEEHMKVHSSCIYCDKIFKDNSHLYKHVQEAHKCYVCLGYFTNVSEHVRLSHPFCELCNRYFIDERRYKWHNEQEHTHRCIYCNTLFKLNKELEKHIKTAHKCRACKKHYGNLQQHFIDKHYYCKRCKKPFFSSQNYNIHQRAHEYTDNYYKELVVPKPSGRPFYAKVKDAKAINCPFCTKKFANEEAKNRHLKEAHPNLNAKTSKVTKNEKKIKCSLCAKKFATEDAKNQHMKDAHPSFA